MKSSFFKNRIYPVLFMFLTTVVFILLTSGVYLYTRDTVAQNEKLFLKKSVLYSAGLSEADDINRVYSEYIREIKDEDDNILYFEILDGERIIGYVFFAGGPGLWGEINAVISVDKNFDTILGLEFTRQNETPGLGARISELWFKEQFRNRQGPFRGIPEGKPASGNEVNVITGATITSDAVLDIINSLLRRGKNNLTGETP